MQRTGGRDDAAGIGLWRFSLALYARPAVADALIALQDRAGHDVNLILFALWLGATTGRVIEGPALAAAQAAIAPLNALAGEWRSHRRRLKHAADGDLQALRRMVLRLELAAEQRVQFRLAGMACVGSEAEPPGDRRAAAEANLAACLGGDSASPEADLLRQAVAALMRRT